MRDDSGAVFVGCGSRLHFGLLSPGGPDCQRRFGGVGLMIEAPRTRITVRPAEAFHVDAEQAPRVERIVAHWARIREVETPCVRVEIQEAPEPHCGWGTGTQLALAVVTALEVLHDGGPIRDVERLARLSGRGQRSAIGLHGFELGGLIVEHGKAADEAVAPLGQRLAWPEVWPIVLLTPRGGPRVYGQREQAAFAELGGRSDRAASQRELLNAELAPAAMAGDYERFAHALGRFNRQSGEFFSPLQGGAYMSPWHQEQIDWLARRGIHGAGQSSWGPTLFAVTPDGATAAQLARDWLSASGGMVDVRVAQGRNRGRDLGVWMAPRCNRRPNRTA